MASPDGGLLQHSKLREGDPPHQRTDIPPAVRPRCKKGVPPAVPPRHKRGHLMSFLGKLGLLELYPNKLTLSSLLEISNGTMSDKEVESLKDIPLAFIRKLLMINTKCRNHTSADSGKAQNRGNDDEEEEINPLDLVTALYLCADSFLQQEMSIKMSMCQFAVPFLLPRPDNNQCTLMLWALRNIYKEWRPHDLMHTKNHVEDSVVHAPIPLITFVRLKDCRLSKSQFINHILSSPQQSIHFFTHRDMDGGNVTKKIANGLVEIVWCLPCGQSNIDVFPEPVAIANMRGDIFYKETQFSFLMQVSTAVFVFFDTMNQEEERLLDLQGPLKSKLFLVMNSEMEGHQSKSLDILKLQENHVLIRKRNLNMAKFSKQIIGVITTALDECKKINIEKMSDIAHDLGISVDECKNEASLSAKIVADNIMKGNGERPIPVYKKKQLPLQGEYFKKIAEIEMEECRLQKAGDLSLEKYKAQLQGEKCTLRKQQGSIRTAQAMGQFIKALSTTDKQQRTFFLKWMSLKLDRKSHFHLTELRKKIKETGQGKDNISTQQLRDNSLGIEHYMREMGQKYESRQSNVRDLPSIAAELLLDGYPMELLDGDASIIPEKWVTDVLMEVHRKVGSTRLLVVSVLGVQSTGKSTLLNTMFGVQFPVSSGRCTRGAYMLFLSVGEELREELKCDFVLLIDTEGLKAPELVNLDSSYEHDNQLATLVMGLSDVTIINIAMENSTEMKDVLQIAVHAFLRMKQLGKKPVCHFVHQNVSGVSAHSKLMTDRKHLLDQLNEMAKIAAEMENQSEVKEFTDVLDYDVENNNWYIPGLWHGTPPMAPVNSGYSEAVHELKRSLLKPMNTKHLSEIPDFLIWMNSLWNAVKHENFIFSFRNTLVAYAYDSLCKEFSGWEWSFRKCIYSWLNNAETQISNMDTSRVENLSGDLELDALKVIEEQTAEINKKLKEYYKRRDRHVNLVERYRVDFQINIQSLGQEMTTLVNNKLQSAVCLKLDMERVENIQKEHTDVIEKKVSELLKMCKEHRTELSDSDLEEAFKKMWTDATRGISPLKERDICSCVMKQLRINLARRNAQEELSKIGDLTRCGLEDFEVKKTYITSKGRMKIALKGKNIISEIQEFAENIIQSCKEFIEDIVRASKDYQDHYSKELLEKIDVDLKTIAKKTNITFETDLKVHICGIAARRFLEMHRHFLSDKNPQKYLERSKSQYLSDFIDSYRQRDQCHRKAQAFTQLCIKPAVIEYINRSLGIEIVDGILSSSHSSQYNSRSYFQYTILAELLEKDDFSSFLRYILQYKSFVKKWIYNQVIEWLSKDMDLLKLKDQLMKAIVQKIKEKMKLVQTEVNDHNGTEKSAVFVEKLCRALSKEISLPKNTVRGVLFQMSCRHTPFIDSLLQSLDDLKKQLFKEFAESTDIEDALNTLRIKPQNVIFKRVFGCGKRCPFCKIPCEAGGKDHTQHHATVHRPQGLAGFVYKTGTLDEQLCTTCVYSDGRFQNDDTNYEYHPFKEYRVYYPDWNIAPDPSIQASDYWKYVLVKYNDEFADNYDATPAVCPHDWHSITKEQALEGLKSAFNVK